MITIPISIGELIDKLSILRVKQQKISNSEKLKLINTEFELLYNVSSHLLKNDNILKFYHELIDVNLKLWEIEDELRVIESSKVFDSVFIELARKVYYTNDERFLLKNKINELTSSKIREVKDYVKYK